MARNQQHGRSGIGIGRQGQVAGYFGYGFQDQRTAAPAWDENVDEDLDEVIREASRPRRFGEDSSQDDWQGRSAPPHSGETSRPPAPQRQTGTSGPAPRFSAAADGDGAGGEPAPTSYRGRGPKGYARSDARIREEVCELLTEDELLDASSIDVSVTNGEVTLTGTVDSRQSKRAAEQLAEQVRGVVDIRNELRLQHD